MDMPFRYRSGELHCEGVPASRLAAVHGTPCYAYSAGAFLSRYRAIRDAFAASQPLVCFSVKSCANLSILRLLAREGSGFDIVSGGELYRALRAGADPAGIVFAGAGKTESEIRYALGEGIDMFNVESAPELRQLDRVARQMGTVADCALRVNPDVEPNTHQKTTTGKGGTKFGIGIARAEELARRALDWPGVAVRGVHMHLGSPICSTEPYVDALQKLVAVVERLRSQGTRIDSLNVGGGFCISYTGGPVLEPADYARAMQPYLEKLNCRVIIEPGRYIAGNSAVLLTQVIYRKETEFAKRFLICDAAMNDLIRPTLYGAYQRIWPAQCGPAMPDVMRPEDKGFEGIETELVDVVGPVCETGDYLALERPLPRVEAGALLAVFDAGAYGFTMSSNYNGRPRAAEVLVHEDEHRLIRRRETWEDLVEPELSCL